MAISKKDESERIIRRYGLEPLDREGGFFRRVYTSGIERDGLFQASGIYYLITRDTWSSWHRLKSREELFHYYAGDAARMRLISPVGDFREIHLGPDPGEGHVRMAVVPPGWWQTTSPLTADRDTYTFFGINVVPAFEWEDFETIEESTLRQRFPSLSLQP